MSAWEEHLEAAQRRMRAVGGPTTRGSRMTCPHGMPSAASCITCMEDGPVGPPPLAPEQRPRAERWMSARYDGRCARNQGHAIEAGEEIGYLPDFGWCCDRCAS